MLKQPGAKSCSVQDSARNTGLSMVLLALLVAWLAERPVLVPVALGLLLASLLFPRIFQPVVAPWLALSYRFGVVSTWIILTALFLFVVTPVGLFRRLAGADPMQRRQWQQGNESVLLRRDHLYRPEDLKYPY